MNTSNVRSWVQNPQDRERQLKAKHRRKKKKKKKKGEQEGVYFLWLKKRSRYDPWKLVRWATETRTVNVRLSIRFDKSYPHWISFKLTRIQTYYFTKNQSQVSTTDRETYQKKKRRGVSIEKKKKGISNEDLKKDILMGKRM